MVVVTDGSDNDSNEEKDDDDDEGDDEELVEGEARLEIFHGKNQLTSVYLEALLIGHEEMVTSVAWHPNPEPIYQQDLILISGSMDRTIFIWSSTEGNSTGFGVGGKSNEMDGVWTPIARVGSAGGILGGSVGSSLLGFLNVKTEPLHGRWIMGHAYGGALHLFSCEKIRDVGGGASTEIAKTRTIEERAALVLWKAQPCVTGHFGEVTDLCWEAHQGDYLITVSNDQTCRLWAPMEKTHDVWIEVSRPQVHGYNISAVTSLSTADQRHRLVTGADEKELRAFDGTLSFMRTLQMIAGGSEESIDGESSDPRVERAYIPALGLTNKASAADGADEDTGGASKSDTRLLLERDLGSTVWPEARKLFGHNSEIARLTSTHAARSCLSAQYATPYMNETIVASTTKARDVDTAAIRLWDAEYKCKQVLKGGHRSTVTALSFSPDGRFLASSGKDRRLCIWKRRTVPDEDQKLFSLDAAVDSSHKRIVWSVHFCPYDPTILASGSRDGTVKLWKLNETVSGDGEAETEIQERFKFIPRPGEKSGDGKAFAVTSLAFAPLEASSSMGLLALGFEDGLLQLWSVPLSSSENTLARLVTAFDSNTCHIGAVNSIAWKPSSGCGNRSLTLASCSSDCGCRIFRIDISEG
ncbi:MAG: hypothetical protein SGILL_001230 [Bacillariaceae sp.]